MIDAVFTTRLPRFRYRLKDKQRGSRHFLIKKKQGITIGRHVDVEMGGAVPWTVKTTRRKATTNIPNPRKRRRASLPADDQSYSRTRPHKQQTLTQIQWALSASVSFDERVLEPFDVKTEARGPSKPRIPRLKKRDSTLTQMDFLLGRSSVELNEQELMPLPFPKEEATAVPQLDGNYDSPRKPRPSKTSITRAGSQWKRKSISLSADESQEYLPAMKRKKGTAEPYETSDHGHRRSHRHASKIPSDPAENFAIFQEALADVVPTAIKPALEVKDSTGLDNDIGNVAAPYQNNPFSSSARPILENQDSIDDMDEDVEILPTSPAKTIPKMIIKTPQKKRRYIPSSQSPESLPPSTRKKHEVSRSRLETTPRHNPLSEMSTNTPSRRPAADIDHSSMAKSTSKRKICTLKLPRIPLASMRKRVEDSQIDIWSVQPTSSSKPKSDSQKVPQSQNATPFESIQNEMQVEISTTSQAGDHAAVTSSPPQPAGAETQESLIILNAIFGIERKDTANTNEKKPGQSSPESDVNIKDFATHPQQTPQKETQYVRFLQSQPEHIDENDQFGSPIANDTQFVADLARIRTSPLRTSDPVRHLNPYDTVVISSSSDSEGNEPTSSLPSPKLVDRVEYQNSTTIIPTKDLSSPILPPMPPPTQRPICPASLPHPSQMSTQDPSQQLLQLSSVPQRSSTHTQRITIKDSSSIHEHLSQLPEYNEDELQLQRELEGTRHGVLEAEDDDDDDVYDDLDPRTPRKVVRFEQMLQENELPRDLIGRSAPSPSRHEAEANDPDPSPPANFTQNGHVTAARIEDMRRRGLIPRGYNPPAYKVPSARELLPAWMFEDDDDEL